ncbi:5-carboxymethyl-2-hydroxymuconate Delta-isomerase [Pseudomonas sp. LA21]|uniref:5-carboxymethyl-2-hydroxymuconate Delta-isomerase n=1 Tax=unclassified Pseudomonas TaxID=196821 RepID=UPI001FB78532|nr:5-carboxymethyl-2-hydroxymuconate Delta-isomerase [Pseudomonas sp. LA21]MCJ1885438.1 5-carboxymethyl-2-hydroxymuconate Delta-isomerase [Pseudomonas sp. LA21]
MPHIAITYTANLTDDLQPLDLPRKLHEAAQAMGVFPINGLRTFARAIGEYRVGANTTNEAFINIQVRIAPGRPEELRQRIVDTLFSTAEQTLAELIARRPVGLQLEITEFDRSLTRMAGSLPTA